MRAQRQREGRCIGQLVAADIGEEALRHHLGMPNREPQT